MNANSGIFLWFEVFRRFLIVSWNFRSVMTWSSTNPQNESEFRCGYIHPNKYLYLFHSACDILVLTSVMCCCQYLIHIVGSFPRNSSTNWRWDEIISGNISKPIALLSAIKCEKINKQTFYRHLNTCIYLIMIELIRN